MPVTMARSFSNRVAIRYVLPVLWMTSWPGIGDAENGRSRSDSPGSSTKPETQSSCVDCSLYVIRGNGQVIKSPDGPVT